MTDGGTGPDPAERWSWERWLGLFASACGIVAFFVDGPWALVAAAAVIAIGLLGVDLHRILSPHGLGYRPFVDITALGVIVVLLGIFVGYRVAAPSSAAGPDSEKPRITLDQNRAKPGGPVAVTGRNFAAGEPVTIHLLDETPGTPGGTYKLGQTKARRDGTFTINVSIPSDASIDRDNIYRIRATGGGGGQPDIQEFDVT